MGIARSRHTCRAALALVDATDNANASFDASNCQLSSGVVHRSGVDKLPLSKNECPPTGLKPHTDVLKEFPYLGTPHSK